MEKFHCKWDGTNLLEHLASELGVFYLSDLHLVIYREAMMKTISGISERDYPETEWVNVARYLFPRLELLPQASIKEQILKIIRS